MSKQPQSCSGACPKFKTMCGGQALIEGIMMRGPKKQAIVVRRQDGGLEVKEEDLKLVKDKNPIWGLPVLRGVIAFMGSMINGVKALMFSADFYPEEEGAEEQPSKLDLWLEEKLGSEKAYSVIVALAVIMGVGFSVGLFFVLPTLAVSLLAPVLPFYWLRSLLEGVVRIILFLCYLILCSRMKDMKRVFAYHGAEHKTIFCYEAGLDLTVENVRSQPKHHPRCGTSFLFVVMVVSILVFSVVRVDGVLLRLVSRLLLLPLVVGITYEINRYVGRHDNAVTRVMTAPGLWLQNFTTNEPDDSMIEVAIEALKRVLPEEKGSDAW